MHIFLTLYLLLIILPPSREFPQQWNFTAADTPRATNAFARSLACRCLYSQIIAHSYKHTFSPDPSPLLLTCCCPVVVGGNFLSSPTAVSGSCGSYLRSVSPKPSSRVTPVRRRRRQLSHAFPSCLFLPACQPIFFEPSSCLPVLLLSFDRE